MTDAMTDLLACELVSFLRDAFPVLSAEQETQILWRLASIEAEAMRSSRKRGAISRLLQERRAPRLFTPVQADLSDLPPEGGLSQWARQVRTTVLPPKRR